jgi:hypothetical protein
MERFICPRLLTVAALVLAGASVSAQPAATGLQPDTNPAPTQPEQAIQRIVVEDAGSRIEEVRVGGETKSITVQPKTRLPAYEVLPTDGTKGGGTEPATTGAGSTGKRVWNVFKF